MFTARFWRLAVENAVGSFAAATGATLGAAGLGVVEADWLAALSLGGMAAALSILKSLAATGVGDSQSPSLL